MTQLGTGIRIALTLGILDLAACASTAAANRVDELREDGSAGAGGASAGNGDSGIGGAPSGGGSNGQGGKRWEWECLGGIRSCRDGIVYEFITGYVPDMNCARPVSTCPYGCNDDWNWRDAASSICAPPPPGCDDAGNCTDAGSAPGSEPTDAGDADTG